MQHAPRPTRAISGWLIVNKPEGVRSTPLTSKLRYLFGAKKAGHAGTLDEQACGLFAIAFGEATKTIPFLLQQQKTYRFALQWGLATDSHDRAGRTIATSGKTPSAQAIEALLPRFTGSIKQTPPCFSAVKVSGVRAWRFARQQVPAKKQIPAPTLKPRPVEVFSLRLLNHCEKTRQSLLEARTGKGVYIRALARDLSEALAMPAFVAKLERLDYGPFSLAQSHSPSALYALGDEPTPNAYAALDACLLPFEAGLAHLPQLALSPPQAVKLRQGQAVPCPPKMPPLKGQGDLPLDLAACMGEKKGAGECRLPLLACCEKSPVALVALVALVEPERAMLKPLRVFNL